jgi:glycosyltransferase involved in cell wall biosynthesis
LYDFENWAIYNVGKMWLEDIINVEAVYKKSTDLKLEDFQNFDLIWFGYLDLFTNTYLTWGKASRHHKSKIVVSVHDPLELYPQVENWKNLKYHKFRDKDSARLRQKVKALRLVKNIVVASNEMQEVLKKYRLNSYVIPTTSMLPAREKIKPIRTSILSVYQEFARKNIPLMDAIKVYCEENLDLRYDRKVGRQVLPVDKYIDLLDAHPIYLCASIQEGGPLTAMDAMKRGAVVLTTPVGQLQDIIKHGVNGYICRTELDFFETIKNLKNDPSLLEYMRQKSLDAIVKTRDLKKIKKTTLLYLEQIGAKNHQA